MFRQLIPDDTWQQCFLLLLGTFTYNSKYKFDIQPLREQLVNIVNWLVPPLPTGKDDSSLRITPRMAKYGKLNKKIFERTKDEHHP